MAKTVASSVCDWMRLLQSSPSGAENARVEFHSILISLSHHQCPTGTNGPLAAGARPCQPAPQVSGTGAADAPKMTARLYSSSGDGGRSGSEEASRYSGGVDVSETSNPMLHGESWVTAYVHSAERLECF